MVGGETTAVGVERESRLIKGQVSIVDELPDFALAAEAKVFQHHRDRDRERVVDHRNVDLIRGHACLAEGRRRALRAG